MCGGLLTVHFVCVADLSSARCATGAPLLTCRSHFLLQNVEARLDRQQPLQAVQIRLNRTTRGHDQPEQLREQQRQFHSGRLVVRRGHFAQSFVEFIVDSLSRIAQGMSGGWWVAAAVTCE